MRLFLLDGMALIYRAHFAFITNPIRNSKGVNTSAVYGFTNTLLNIIEKEKPTHLGVAFDTAAPTPRHIQYPAYKAQRDATPEELLAAIPMVKKLCVAFDIPILEIDGFEADDIIGTLAKRADADGNFQTFMVTPDKDFSQLVTSRSSVWRPGKKGADHDILDVPAVLAQWEISRTEQVIDILGLWGDASDNIPGVPGIGEKTAKKLIAEWDSVENLLENASKIKGKLGENLSTYSDQAILSKQLATIIIDVPVDVTWDELALSPINESAVRNLFQELEFKTLTKRIFAEKNPEPTAEKVEEEAITFANITNTPHSYHLADTEEKISQLLAALEKQTSFCFDTETTALNRFTAKLLGIAFSWQAHDGWYLPFTSPLAEAHLAKLKNIFAAPTEKIGHNLKFDIAILQNHGIEIGGTFFDTMLAHTLMHPEQRHSMDRLAESLLHYTPIKFSDIAENKSAEAPADDLFSFAASNDSNKNKKDLSVADISLQVLAEYAAEDADITFQLAQKLRPELEQSGQMPVFHDVECPLIATLVRMENHGITVDREALSDIGKDLQETIDSLTKTIHAHAGKHFNINSPKQLGEILFDQLNLAEKAKKTATGQFKTDEATLETLQGKHPIIADILAYREATKLKSTYVDSLPNHIEASTGRIHTTFHQLLAATGRLASSDPNLQNIPIRSVLGKKIRRAFVPDQSGDYTLLSCDYSQVELRIMAALSGDENMIDAFARGLDIHTATAARVFHVPLTETTSEMRRTAKMVNFGIIYGISAFGLSQRLGIARTEAANIIDTYFSQYPGIKNFMDETIEKTRRQGYIKTLTGRRRNMPDIHSANANIRGNAERAAINTPIQGSAADMIKIAMNQIQALLSNKNTKMLLQVHDELVFDLHLSEQEELVPQIIHIMTTALPLPNDVPILVEHGTGANWLAAH